MTEVVLRPAANSGSGVVLWQIRTYVDGLISQHRLKWFPDRETAARYMGRHPDLARKWSQSGV